MYQVIYSEPAENDLYDIIDYRAQYNLEKALAFADELQQSFTQTLSEFPNAGTIHKTGATLRQFTHKPYTAFYEVQDDRQEVHIFRVLDLTKPLEARNITF